MCIYLTDRLISFHNSNKFSHFLSLVGTTSFDMKCLHFILFVCLVNSFIIFIFGQIPKNRPNARGIYLVPFLEKIHFQFPREKETYEQFKKYSVKATPLSQIVDLEGLTSRPFLMPGQIPTQSARIINPDDLRNIYNFRVLSIMDDRPNGFENRAYNVIEPTTMEPSNGNGVTRAYWAHQGRFVDIPIHPTGDQPKYLFTPPFSGCSLAVDMINEDQYRVYHVEGGHEDNQYNALRDHGLGMVKTITFRDYGVHVNVNSEVIQNSLGLMFLSYSDQLERWTINYQNLYIQDVIAIPQVKEIKNVRGDIVVDIYLPPNRKIEVVKATKYIIRRNPAKEYVARIRKDRAAEVDPNTYTSLYDNNQFLHMMCNFS